MTTILWNVFPVLLSIWGLAKAQTCDRVYGHYLQCIDGAVDRSYVPLERELQSDFKNQVENCFTNSTRDPTKCYFGYPDQFSHDVFGDNGPLQGCGVCLKVAKFIKKIFFESDPESMACVRNIFKDAMKTEAEHCITGKLNRPFRIGEIPDFDRQAAQHRELVASTVQTFIGPLYELELCHLGALRQKLDARVPEFTKTCMEKPVRGSFRAHCEVTKACKLRSVPAQCASSFTTVEKYACECFHEKRSYVKRQIRQVPRRISALLKQYPTGDRRLGSACVNTISQLLKTTSGVDWKTVIDTGISQCLRGQLPRIGTKQINVDTMLNLGCKFAISRIGRGGLKELAIGTRFLQVVVDALVARVNRFCGGDHCLA